MSFVTILEFSDDGLVVKVEVSSHGLVHITEGANTDFPGHVSITIEGFASIGEAVAQHLESAAEPLFTEEEVS